MKKIICFLLTIFSAFVLVTKANAAENPLRISEVKASDYGINHNENEAEEDWVELFNSGTEELSLEGCYLTDKKSELAKFPLEGSIGPGEYKRIFPSFGLDSAGETLYLTDGKSILDSFEYSAFPYWCTVGRMAGETKLCYFETPTPAAPNQEGKHILSQTPVSLQRDGIFEGVDSVIMKLEAPGKIYYTTDGTLPSEDDILYTGPVEITESCAVRAVCIEEDGVKSYPLNLNYFINEGFTLPVLSLCLDESRLNDMKLAAMDVPMVKLENPGSISLYSGEEQEFSLNCGITLAGQASLSTGLVKKISFDAHFRDSYGQGELVQDLFGKGEESYSSINIHAGQDSENLMFDAEVWEDLCLGMGSSLYTQNSRFCILYLNGEYWGIYCIKDDINKAGYANRTGAKKSEVECCESFYEEGCAFCEEVYDFACENDLSDPENYALLCSRFDIDSYIDWCIMQGVSSNSDLFSNIKIFRAGDGKWQYALFDLDHAMLFPGNAWNLLFGNYYYECFPNEMAIEFFSLLRQSPEFTSALTNRYEELYDSALSNEKILERIDYYYNLLLPEAKRDRERWGFSLSDWEDAVEDFKTNINRRDWQNFCMEKFKENSDGTA